MPIASLASKLNSGNGVEHPDKTLLFGGIWRQLLLYLIEETMLIASLALNLDFDGKFGQYTGFNVQFTGRCS